MADQDQDVIFVKQLICVHGQWIRIEVSNNANHGGGANIPQAQIVQHDARVHLTGAGDFDVANIADCPGCTCIIADDLPWFPERIGNIAHQYGLAQLEVSMAEIEGAAYGLEKHYMHEFIADSIWETRGSVREHALYLEYKLLGQSSVGLLLTAKKAELRELNTLYERVRSLQAPDVGVRTAIGSAEQEFNDKFKDIRYLQTRYNVSQETFDVIYQSAKHLGLSNMDIHEYLVKGNSARKRGPIEVWAVKKRAEGLTQEERLAEIRRRDLEIEVLQQVAQDYLSGRLPN